MSDKGKSNQLKRSTLGENQDDVSLSVPENLSSISSMEEVGGGSILLQCVSEPANLAGSYLRSKSNVTLGSTGNISAGDFDVSVTSSAIPETDSGIPTTSGSLSGNVFPASVEMKEDSSSSNLELVRQSSEEFIISPMNFIPITFDTDNATMFQLSSPSTTSMDFPDLSTFALPAKQSNRKISPASLENYVREKLQRYESSQSSFRGSTDSTGYHGSSESSTELASVCSEYPSSDFTRSYYGLPSNVNAASRDSGSSSSSSRPRSCSLSSLGFCMNPMPCLGEKKIKVAARKIRCRSL